MSTLAGDAAGKNRADDNVGEDPEDSWTVRFEGQFFKTKICSFWQKGACRRGRNCKYAHGDRELNAQPDLTRTALCRDMLNYGQCNVENCGFAHSAEELRATKNFFKTTMCSFQKIGKCRLGNLCRHAHCEDELEQTREPPPKPRHPVPARMNRRAKTGRGWSRMMTDQPIHPGQQDRYAAKNNDMASDSEDLEFDETNTWERMQTTPASSSTSMDHGNIPFGNRCNNPAMAMTMDLPQYPPSVSMCRNRAASMSMDFAGNYVGCVSACSGKDTPMTMSMDLPQYPANMGMECDGRWASSDFTASVGMDTNTPGSGSGSWSHFRRQTTDEHFRRQHTDEVDLEAEAMNEVNFIFGRGQTMPASFARRPSFRPQAESDHRRFHAGASSTLGCLPSMDFGGNRAHPTMQTVPDGKVPDLNEHVARQMPPRQVSGQRATVPGVWNCGGTAERTQHLPQQLPSQQQQQQQQKQQLPQNGYGAQAHSSAAATSGNLPSMELCWVVGNPNNHQVQQVTPASLLSFFQQGSSGNQQLHQDPANLDSLDEFEDGPWERAQTLPAQFPATSPKQATHSYGCHASSRTIEFAIGDWPDARVLAPCQAVQVPGGVLVPAGYAAPPTFAGNNRPNGNCMVSGHCAQGHGIETMKTLELAAARLLQSEMPDHYED